MTTSRIADLSGYVTAVPTPFRNDAIDLDTFRGFCQWQIAQGIAALAVTATTGESPTLTDGEQRRLIRAAVTTAAGRVPVIAGAGSCDTRHAVELARQAEEAGADALLCVTPYYNRPSQEGLFRHFEAIHEATTLPIILYDVPTRTGCPLALDTLVRLAELSRIVGLKDATGDVARPLHVRKLLGADFRLFSGDDETALDFIALGGDGCISVVSNVAPGLCVRAYTAYRAGDNVEVKRLARDIGILAEVLFVESNPVPVKYALGLMGRMAPAVRLPLCPPSSSSSARSAETLSRLNLLPRLPSRGTRATQPALS